MKISSITASQPSQVQQKSKQPAFKKYVSPEVLKYDKRLSNWISSHRMGQRDINKPYLSKPYFFIKECFARVGDIYKKVYPDKFRPNLVSAKPLESGTYGQYEPGYHEVSINSDMSCFDDKESLTAEMKKSKNIFFLPDEKSTTHYLRTYIHEFAHNAHHRNLEENHHSDAIYALQNMSIPTTIGKFVTMFKLGNYAATNMAEFMAERISKDICTRLDYNDNFIGNKEDLNYHNIFDRKWNCRYITPQSYLDYYTQQVWRGDIEGANRVLNDMEEYIAVLEKGLAVSAVEIERSKAGATLKQKSLLGRLDAFFGRVLSTPQSLDNDNKLKIKL